MCYIHICVCICIYVYILGIYMYIFKWLASCFQNTNIVPLELPKIQNDIFLTFSRSDFKEGLLS